MTRLMLAAALGLAALAPAVASAQDARPLSLETIDKVIESHDRDVQACGRSRSRDVLAVLMHLEIDAEGKVSLAEPSSQAPGPEAKCLQKVAKKLVFPASGMPNQVDFPFMLVGRR